VVEAVATILRAYDPEGDEGKTPVEVEYDFS
jgi:hypothetical protein